LPLERKLFQQVRRPQRDAVEDAEGLVVGFQEGLHFVVDLLVAAARLTQESLPFGGVLFEGGFEEALHVFPSGGVHGKLGYGLNLRNKGIGGAPGRLYGAGPETEALVAKGRF
jgi:hypothetical protein